jgi:hypothetical protein
MSESLASRERKFWGAYASRVSGFGVVPKRTFCEGEFHI